MDYQRKSNGWLTLLEHYWLWVVVLSSVFASAVLRLFSQLTGTQWSWVYAMALCLAGIGIGLIFYAKLPLYRERRFFTFGRGTIPSTRQSIYRWGYRCAIIAAALLLCLSLSRP